MFKITKTEQVFVDLSKMDVGDKSINVHKVDWNLLYDLAVKHRTFSIIYLNCIINNLFPNKFILEKFENKYIKLKNMRELYYSIAESINALAKEKKVQFMYLKGYYLNLSVYKNLRDFHDIDIAVDESNFELLIDVLEELGFSFWNKSPRAIIKYIFNNSAERLFEAYKIIDGKRIIIDIHKIVDKSPECLDDIYTCSLNESGIHYPSMLGTLIFSCYHAWHHYPHTFRVINNEQGTTLKDLMDIREVYLILKSKKLERDIYEYASSIGAFGVVSEMISISEKIYGDFVSEQFKFNFVCLVKHDFYSNEYNSTFESRFFRGELERELLLSFLKKHSFMLSNGDKIVCLYITDTDNRSIKEAWSQINFSTLKNGFWNNLYGTFNSNTIYQEAMIGLLWTENYFICGVDVLDPFCSFGNTPYYDETQDAINLIFPDNCMTLSLQLKNDYSAKAFKLDKSEFIKIPLSKCDIRFIIHEKGYKIVSLIPWEYIDIDICESKEFNLYVNVKVGDARNFDKKVLMPFGKSTLVTLVKA